MTSIKNMINKALFPAAAILVFFTAALTGCAEDTALFDDGVRYTASPVENNYRLDYSDTDGSYDYYYIYLGKVDFVPISAEGTKYYNGQTPISLSYSTEKVTVESISAKNEYCITNSTQTIVSDSHALSFKQSANISIKKIFGLTQDRGYEYTRQAQKEKGYSQSTTNTYTSFQSWQKSHSETVSYTIGEHGEKAGYYRYALFVSADVYVNVIYDRAAAVWYYEYSSFARADTFFTAIDFSLNNDFKSSEDTVRLKFDSSVIDTLQAPETVRPE